MPDPQFWHHHEHTTDAPVGVDGPLAWRILNADVQHTETTIYFPDLLGYCQIVRKMNLDVQHTETTHVTEKKF